MSQQVVVDLAKYGRRMKCDHCKLAHGKYLATEGFIKRNPRDAVFIVTFDETKFNLCRMHKKIFMRKLHKRGFKATCSKIQSKQEKQLEEKHDSKKKEYL